MMRHVPHRLTADGQGDWIRNIVSLRQSRDLFADLVDDPAESEFLQQHELATKPMKAHPTVVQRPFEETAYLDAIATAIQWPFEHPCQSRFSAGHFGAWYGARSTETSIFETVYHFVRNTMSTHHARTSDQPIIQERRVHLVNCSAKLVDLRPACRKDARLLDRNNYTFCQHLGADIHSAGKPGLLTRSARHASGEIIAVFDPNVLTRPRTHCYLTYTLHPRTLTVTIERTPGSLLQQVHYAEVA